MQAMGLYEAHEIADGLDPVDDIVSDFDAKAVFDHDHQFEAVEPVGAQIPEMGFVRDPVGVDPQMLGNEIAHLRGNVFVHGR